MSQKFEELNGQEANFDSELRDFFRLDNQSISPHLYELYASFERELDIEFVSIFGQYLTQDQQDYWLNSNINVLGVDESVNLLNEYCLDLKTTDDYVEQASINGRFIVNYDVIDRDLNDFEKVSEWNIALDPNPSMQVDESYFYKVGGFHLQVGKLPILIDRGRGIGMPGIDNLKFAYSSSVGIAYLMVHEKLHGTFNSILPLNRRDSSTLLYEKVIQAK